MGGGGLVTVGGAISLMGDTQFQVDGGSTLILTNPATITGIAGALSTNVTLGADANGVGTFIAPLSLGGGCSQSRMLVFGPSPRATITPASPL